MYRISAKAPQQPRKGRTHANHHSPDAITTLAKEYPAGWHVTLHRHQRGQFVYAASGVMRVTTKKGIWIVPPQRALWMPAGMMHEIRMESGVAMRTLYLHRALCTPMGEQCKVIFVSRLLRELVLEMVLAPRGKKGSGRKQLITPLLLSELRNAEQTPIHIPAPSDPRLKKVCERLLNDASRVDNLDQLALDAGASSRTLARLFQRELKMTFVEWRQHVRLAKALSQLAVGHSVKQVARDAGYESCSAFTAMFHHVLGITPTSYLRQEQA